MAGTMSTTIYTPPTLGENTPLTSYKSIYALRDMFRRSGGKQDEFNTYDNPGLSYFRLFFYFDNHSTNDSSTGSNASNLLSLDIDTETLKSKQSRQNATPQTHTFANSALNYLLINNEYERAELLLQFIKLLSNINTYSPWYFSEVQGLGEAVSRKEWTSRDFKIDEERKALTIKCLPDSFDNRIGTLIDLYKEICFSYVLKKEIVPANLRKFDMGVYLFNYPVGRLHRYRDTGSSADQFVSFDETKWEIGSECMASAKYFEFHNCEIDPGSLSSGIDTLNNSEGSNHEYSIRIMYDTCYESRYNEFLMRDIGDRVYSDLYQYANASSIQMSMQGNIPEANLSITNDYIKRSQLRQSRHLADFDNISTSEKQFPDGVNPNFQPTDSIEPESSFRSSARTNGNIITNLVGGAVSGAVSAVSSKLKNIYMGNIYSGQGIQGRLTQASQTLQNIANGSIVRSEVRNAMDSALNGNGWGQR